MIGNRPLLNKDRDSKQRLIIQPRDLRLLRELATLRVVDREQAKIVAGFRSTTRANARLLTLTRAGLLKRFFLGSGGGRKALYAQSARGAALAGVPHRGPRRHQGEMLVADFYIEHQLAVNDLYCRLNYRKAGVSGMECVRWVAFYQQITPSLSLIPDGYIEFRTPTEMSPCFLEVDLGHEGLAVWKEKARNYLQLALSGEYARHFGQDRFRVLVIVSSERRLQSIRKTLATVTEKLFWFATLESANKDFFAPIWRRPVGHQPKALFE